MRSAILALTPASSALGEDFDSVVTISEVDGPDYTVSVTVAEEPRE